MIATLRQGVTAIRGGWQLRAAGDHVGADALIAANRGAVTAVQVAGAVAVFAIAGLVAAQGRRATRKR